MAVKYDCDVVPFKNRPIKVVVEASSKTIWLHLYDICVALKRPMMVKIRGAQGLCPSSTRIVFNKYEPEGKWAINPIDIDKLVVFLKKESKSMEKLCAELIVWRDNLPVELERSRSKKKEDCTETKLLLDYEENKPKEGDIKLFENPMFGQVRTVVKEGKHMFVAKDIATALGYKNTAEAIATHCKSGNIENHSVSFIPHSNGFGGTNVVVIGESNVYRLVMRSCLPNAERFQDWVCDDVLPSIRQTGGYVPVKAGDSDDDIMARALLIAKNTLAAKDHIIEEQKTKIIADQHKVEFYEDFVENRDYFKTTTIADELRTTAYRLNEFLRDWEVINPSSKGKCMTYSWNRHLQCDVPYINADGQRVESQRRIRWTREGRDVIVELWKAKHE